MSMDEYISGICALNPGNTFGLFDFQSTPLLLFATSIPLVIISLFFAAYFITREGGTRRSWLLFFITAFYTLWVGLDIIIWTATSHQLIITAYAITPFIESIMAGCAYLFALSIFRYPNGNTPLRTAIFVAGIPLVFAILAPTTLIAIGWYDPLTCSLNSGGGIVWRLLYIYEIVLGVLVLSLTGKTLQQRDAALGKQKVTEHPLIGVGLSLLLFFFAIGGISTGISGDLHIGLSRSIGMMCFWLAIFSVAMRSTFLSTKISITQVLITILWLTQAVIVFIRDSVVAASISRISVGPLAILSIYAFLRADRERNIHDQLQEASITLQKQNNQLLELNQTKTEFLSFVTHQLRAPLTALQWGIETAIQQTANLPEETQNIIKQLNITVQQMSRTVTDFLSESRFDQGIFVLHVSKIDLVPMIKKLINEYQPVAESKKITLDCVTPERLIGSFDEVKIEQVLGNVIDNALKFTTTGGVMVSAFTRETNIRIEIVDSGAGLLPTEIPELFERFSPARMEQKTDSGSGMGLYVARRIVELHGGVIGAESPGKGFGSTFWIEIPYNDTNESTVVMKAADIF